jgi:hypothetical protein
MTFFRAETLRAQREQLALRGCFTASGEKQPSAISASLRENIAVIAPHPAIQF